MRNCGASCTKILHTLDIPREATMKRAILAAVVFLAVAPTAEGQRRSTTNRDWLQWPQSERAAYFLGFADATSALAGLTCPSDATSAVVLTRA